MTDDTPNPTDLQYGDLSLSDLHERPWSEIDGAYLRIRHEVTDGPSPMDRTRHEAREGRLVGRTEGMGIRYDPHDGKDYASRMGPTVYLLTPEETTLEVMTDKPGNELLAYTPPEDADE